MSRVRKQLYIEAEQEKALKRRAKALGITEAEIVRDALDAALAPNYAPALPENLVALEDVLARAEELATSGHATARGPRWRRDDLYAERERRLTRSR